MDDKESFSIPSNRISMALGERLTLDMWDDGRVGLRHVTNEGRVETAVLTRAQVSTMRLFLAASV